MAGKYAPPRGQLLLATSDGAVAGCVALRDIDAEACAMKRTFVYERFGGQGVGRALAEAIIAEARDLGYKRMLLDTSLRQKEAIQLYQRLGFELIPPYYERPKELQEWLVFMELKPAGFTCQPAKLSRRQQGHTHVSDPSKSVGDLPESHL